MHYNVPHVRATLEYQYPSNCFTWRWPDRELHVYFNEVWNGSYVFCWEVGVFNRSCFCSVSWKDISVLEHLSNYLFKTSNYSFYLLLLFFLRCWKFVRRGKFIMDYYCHQMHFSEHSSFDSLSWWYSCVQEKAHLDLLLSKCSLFVNTLGVKCLSDNIIHYFSGQEPKGVWIWIFDSWVRKGWVSKENYSFRQ